MLINYNPHPFSLNQQVCQIITPPLPPFSFCNLFIGIIILKKNMCTKLKKKALDFVIYVCESLLLVFYHCLNPINVFLQDLTWSHERLMAGRNLKYMLAKYFVFLEGYLLKKGKSAEFCIRLAAQVSKSYSRTWTILPGN